MKPGMTMSPDASITFAPSAERFSPDRGDVLPSIEDVGPGLLAELVVLCQHDSTADEDAIGHGLALLLLVAGGMGIVSRMTREDASRPLRSRDRRPASMPLRG